MKRKPDFVASDAGTIDAGPYHLGVGKGAYAAEALRHDLEILLTEVPRGTPILVGSADTAGGDPHVDRTLEIVREIISRRGLKRRVAVIRSELDRTMLQDALDDGRVIPLDHAPELDRNRLVRSTRVVGMMGVEPLQDALRQDVDFILAGRCSDSALFAALPIMRGIPEGLAWHAGKIVECGTLTCETYGKGSMFGELFSDHGIITPIGEGLRCTPQSVASHSLYENGDPYLHRESSGTLDITHARYEQHDPVSVRISGAAYVHADRPSIKLEGVEHAGYQSVLFGGIRDPFIIRQFDKWLNEVKDEVRQRAARLLGDVLSPDDWRIDTHAYGLNAVMGVREPAHDKPPHEIGLAFCVSAPSQLLANKLAELSRQPLLHHPIPEWSGSITGFACLFNQAHVERGPYWRFSMHHVLLPKPNETIFRTEILSLGDA
ncbi:MAG: acyclic terpene utilization AtuA family protein [Rhizobiales bacterium]|nr:acyclic terpene utilization AtuA family protein [Hyphomicrobiales bacterium]